MIGRKIEQGMELLISISEQFAEKQAQLDKANETLTMYQALFDINMYMSKNIDLNNLVVMVEDVVKGTVGANYAGLVTKNIPEKQIGTHGYKIEYLNLLHEEIRDFEYVSDLSREPKFGLTKGSLFIYKLELLDSEVAYLLGYWKVSNALDDKKINFLKILSIQTELSLKNAVLLEEFKLLAINDPLTGLYNRSYFNNIESTTSPTLGESIIMFDIDNFKRINDTKGHSFGDTILKQFASIIKEVILDEENAIISFKYGGEEFVLGCNGGESEGVRIANIVRKKFQSETGYTVSAGVAGAGESCKISSYGTLMQLADKAMYVAKECGKNKVMTSNSDLQLFDEAGEELSVLLAQAFRHNNSLKHILRLDIVSNVLMSYEDKEEFLSRLKSTIRRSDKVHVTEGLSAMFFVDLQSNIEAIKDRIVGCMQDYYPDLDYNLNSCNSIFKEVSIHSIRVAELAQYLSVPLGMSENEQNIMRLACEWHDVGKLCIDPLIYSKPGKLNDREFERIKYHTWLSYSLAKKDQVLKECADWILKHHEDYNGRGYFGFVGEEIPRAARIISLIDKFDALTEDRCYRKAFTWEEALEILDNELEKFDIDMYIIFKNVITDIYNTNKND